jgi:chromosome segregation ATPase
MSDTSYGTQPQVDELLAALREMDQMLEQMRSQRDVARTQCEDLQRRWQREVGQFEQRLHDSQLECERLRRELDARVESGQQRVRPVRKSEAQNRPVQVARRDDGLRHVFTRIRDRASCR